MAYIDLHKAYSSFLDGKDWDYFVTFTSEYKMTSPAARRLITTFFNKVNKYDAELFWVTEQFKDKSGVHIHALLRVSREGKKVKALGSTYYCSLWQNLSKSSSTRVKNRADVQCFDPSIRGTDYITKDILDAHSDYDHYFDYVK